MTTQRLGFSERWVIVDDFRPWLSPLNPCEVFKGKYTNVKGVTRDVAVKIIHRELAPVVIREKFLPRELEIVQLLRHHENVIKTILINQSNERFWIVRWHLAKITSIQCNLSTPYEPKTDYRLYSYRTS